MVLLWSEGLKPIKYDCFQEGLERELSGKIYMFYCLIMVAGPAMFLEMAYGFI